MNRVSHSHLSPQRDPDRHAEAPPHSGEPSQGALPPGTRLAEYEILSVLCERGSGILYLALDHGLQRKVTIKEYLPAALASRGVGAAVALRSERHGQAFTQGLKAFVDEARLLAHFDHPALMRVHRFWEANGTAYMVMPHYEGVTLGAARRAMARPPDERWLRALLGPLLGALDVLHGASCHDRDISPENILLLADGRPVLLDCCDLHHLAGDGGQAATVVATPAFAPIEHYAESERLRQGPWTDIYALAAVAYYCVSGRPPVASTVRALDDSMEPLFQVVDRLSRSFPELDYSVAFVSAIERALRVRPQERPQSVAEFRRALLGSQGTTEPVAEPQHSEGAPPRAAPTIPFPGAAPSRTRETEPFFVTTPRPAPGGSRDDADDAGLRAALDAALRPDPDDFRGVSPAADGDTPEDRPRRTWMAGAAAVAIIAVLVGAWMMWADDRDGSAAPRSTAIGGEAQVPVAPALPPEPAAQTLEPASSGTLVEPASPPSETDAAEGPPLVEDVPADVPVGEVPPEPPAAAQEAPSPPPPADPVRKASGNPRELCAPRTHFALYRCMKEACERPTYYEHAECRHLRVTDEVRAIP